MKKLLILLLILLALFMSSGQTYEQQSIVPLLQKWFPNKPFEELLMIFQIPYWGITVSVEERGYYYFVEFLIRKGAHFFSFGLIAAFIYSLLPKKASRFTIAALLTLLFAIGDEYRQSLTGGRTPAIKDVMLDMAGAFTALSIIWIFLNIKNRKKRKKRTT